jgi:predicted Rossmann-fold nucleotide-binding protein
MYGGMGVFYEYFSKTTTQNQEKHRAFIVVYNDDSWSTIQLD